MFIIIICPTINAIAVPVDVPIPPYFLAKGILNIIFNMAIKKNTIVLNLYLFLA